jgi:gluconokinase
MTGTLPPVVVMGVSGCGKSTIGALLAGRLGVPFLDGDDFHPAANKEKMAAGTPLTDEDRAPWLDRIGGLLAGALPAGPSGPAVVACSALKRRYRDVLRSHAPGVVFVHLAGDAGTIAGRLEARSHEFMPGTLLASQLATLEALGPDEAHVPADIALRPDEVVDVVIRQLEALAGTRADSRALPP